MKTRIKENRLRFRLTQGEVARLRDGEAVEGRTKFGPSEAEQLVWTISTGPAVGLIYSSGRTSLTILEDVWLEENTDGHDGVTEVILLDGGHEIRVTVERDYRCLVPRDPAEDAGAFPHPKEGEVC